MQGAGRRSGSRTAGSSRWSGGRTRRAGRGSRSLRPTGQVELGVILTWRLPGKRGTACRGADEARRPRCVSLPPTYPSTRPLGGDAHEDGFFPDLEGTRKRLRTPFPGSRTGSNDHLPLWLITFREPPERPAERRPAPFEPGRSARRRGSESQSGRACAESPSRPSSPAKQGPSTRARCWFDDAAGDHNILRSTRVQNLSVSRARQHASPSARSCRFPRPFVSPRRPSLRASSANRHSCAWR